MPQNQIMDSLTAFRPAGLGVSLTDSLLRFGLPVRGRVSWTCVESERHALSMICTPSNVGRKPGRPEIDNETRSGFRGPAAVWWGVVLCAAAPAGKSGIEGLESFGLECVIASFLMLGVEPNTQCMLVCGLVVFVAWQLTGGGGVVLELGESCVPVLVEFLLPGGCVPSGEAAQ